MTPEPKADPQYVWMRPTTHGPACRFKLPRKVTGAGRKLFSECGIWLTPYFKDRVIGAPTGDLCPFCFANKRVASPKHKEVRKHRDESRFNFNEWE